MGFSPGIVRHHASVAVPRAAICHSRNLNIWEAPNFTDRDVTTCIWNTQSKQEVLAEIYLISVYWDRNVLTIPPMLSQVIEHCTENNIEFLCCMDSNAHSTWWGCTRDDRRGQLVEDFIINYNLHLANTGTSPDISR